MRAIRLGRSNLIVSEIGFGGIPSSASTQPMATPPAKSASAWPSQGDVRAWCWRRKAPPAMARPWRSTWP